MKNFVLLFIAAFIFCAACKKKLPTPQYNNSIVADSSGTYYFRCVFLNTPASLIANVIPYPDSQPDLGGFMHTPGVHYPSLGFTIWWHNLSVLHNSDVLALQGKTLYFQDTKGIQPQIYYSTDSAHEWLSSLYADTAMNNIRITDVALLKTDTTNNMARSIYIVTGTCNAFMNNDTIENPLTNGEFHMMMSCGHND